MIRVDGQHLRLAEHVLQRTRHRARRERRLQQTFAGGVGGDDGAVGSAGVVAITLTPNTTAAFAAVHTS